jgi:hypothetical protein
MMIVILMWRMTCALPTDIARSSPRARAAYTAQVARALHRYIQDECAP